MSTSIETRVCDQRRPVEVEGHDDVFIEDGTNMSPDRIDSAPRCNDVSSKIVMEDVYSTVSQWWATGRFVCIRKSRAYL